MPTPLTDELLTEFLSDKEITSTSVIKTDVWGYEELFQFVTGSNLRFDGDIDVVRLHTPRGHIRVELDNNLPKGTFVFLSEVGRLDFDITRAR